MKRFFDFEGSGLFNEDELEAIAWLLRKVKDKQSEPLTEDERELIQRWKAGER